MTRDRTDHPEQTKNLAFQWDDNRIRIAIATAEHLAQRAGRSRGLSQVDREDLRQDILLALVRRAGGYVAQRGAWSTYVKVLARHAIADHDSARWSASAVRHAGEPVPDVAEPVDLSQHLVLRLDLAGAVAVLPPQFVSLIALIAEYGALADAQRASDLTLCAFYRQVADLRMWLRAAGLAPPSREKSAGRPVSNQQTAIPKPDEASHAGP